MAVYSMEYIRLGQADLKGNIGNRIFVTFLARDVSVRLQKDKVTKFVVFNMVDKDVAIEARVFGASDKVIEAIQEGKVYNGAIDIKPYEKAPQGFSCIVYNMDFSDTPPEYFADWADRLEESRDIINNMIGAYYDTYYGQITYLIITNYWDRISKWTAASSMHHTQLGGLLTHTAEVITLSNIIADFLNDRYGDNFINKPLLLCSAALHDVGKIFELNVDVLSGKTEYSTHSLLSSHIMDILTEVDLRARELGFGQSKIIDDDGNITGQKPEDTVEEEKEAIELLKHCLAAHHGKLEFGSPITASVPEAVILNIADNLSAEMFRYNKNLKSVNPGESTTQWINGALAKFYKDSSKIDNIGD